MLSRVAGEEGGLEEEGSVIWVNRERGAIVCLCELSQKKQLGEPEQIRCHEKSCRETCIWCNYREVAERANRGRKDCCAENVLGIHI